jgi:serine/threonine protein kinase
MRQIGRYRVIETLGKGGMGTIQLAVVGGLGRFRKLVVLKVLRGDLTEDPQFVELFMREAALAACLSHPNVVQTVEAGHEDGYYFMVMEFLDGQPLSEILRNAREPRAPAGLRLSILCDALAGLHYAHEVTDYDGRLLHLVHCDVSPPNLFVTYDGQVKLLDFGIAKARDAESSRPGEFKGKIGYAAPEQLRGMPADRRVDVFAAGVVMWEALAARPIAQGKSRRETFAARLSGAEPRIAEVVPDLPPRLTAICDRAMHGDPEQRYQSADAFRKDLLDYLRSHELWVDSAARASFMRSKYSEARALMHRRIDRHLREELSSVTPLTELLASTQHARSGQHELDARPLSPDLHERASFSDLRVPLRKARNTRWYYYGAGAAALALAALAVRTRSCHEESKQVAVMPHSTQAPARDRPDASPSAPAPSDEKRADEKAADERADELPIGREPPPVTHPPRAKAPDDAVAAPRRALTGHRKLRDSGPSEATRDAAGEFDLRSVPRRERRRLDVDNPFR